MNATSTPIPSPATASTVDISPPFPLLLQGEVVKGFGRGSKDLGIPTANLPESVAQFAQTAGLVSGIYYGWAKVQASPGRGRGDMVTSPLAYPMVMSFGWNPYYRNEKRTAEVHILHDFEGRDFYGSDLRVVVVGWIREERDFTGVEALITAIRQDIAMAQASLATPELEALKATFFPG